MTPILALLSVLFCGSLLTLSQRVQCYSRVVPRHSHIDPSVASLEEAKCIKIIKRLLLQKLKNILSSCVYGRVYPRTFSVLIA